MCTQQSTDRYFTIGSLRVVNIILLKYVILSKYITKLTFVYQIINIQWIVKEYKYYHTYSIIIKCSINLPDF